jgi:ADP-ribosylglycohydrolase
MRAAPFGLYFAEVVDALVRAAAAQSGLTHRHPIGVASSVAAAAAMATALRSVSLAGLVASVRAHVERVDERILLLHASSRPLQVRDSRSCMRLRARDRGYGRRGRFAPRSR